MNYETVIGIEIHCELKTKSKMFSGAPVAVNMQPNTCVNEIDLGHPGVLPSLNKEAVRLSVLACSALNLKIDPVVRFDRKNYYYSDLPKGFQITQQFHPIGEHGYIDLELEEAPSAFVSIGFTWKKILRNNTMWTMKHGSISIVQVHL